jgi:hypothetical protein
MNPILIFEAFDEKHNKLKKNITITLIEDLEATT